MLYKWLRLQKSKKSFKKNACIGQNIKLSVNSRCVNCSGQKERIRIGGNSFIMGSIYTTKNGTIEIGENFYLGQNSLIGAEKNIRIGKCVIISNDVKIYDNNNHPVSPQKREAMVLSGFSNDNWGWHHSDVSPVVIEDNVWIGQYVTILKGVTIGKGSVVGTRAVVTKDVPPYTVVAGNPAKVVKRIEEN